MYDYPQQTIEHNKQSVIVSKEDVKLPLFHRNPFTGYKKFYKKWEKTHKEEVAKNPLLWKIVNPFIKKYLPSKEIWWVLDDKNKYNPDTTMIRARRDITYFIVILTWLPMIFYTYKRDNLSISVTLVLLVIELIVFFFYGVLHMQFFTPMVGQKGKIWAAKTITGPEFVIIKNNNILDLGDTALLWDPHKLKEVAKKNKLELTSLVELINSSNTISPHPTIIHSGISRLTLPYYIVTMLVTLGLISVRMGQKVFYNVLPLIIYISLVTLPPLLLWHWNFSSIHQLTWDRDIKNKIIINSTFMSITVCLFVLFWETGTEKILI